MVEKLDANGDGIISFDEFALFNTRYPALLFPAFQMQQLLRQAVFGDPYWAAQVKLRMEIAKERAKNIFEVRNRP
jgi:hypothetical protein